MRAVILCGGNATRLKPASLFYNKGLIEVGKKLVVDYPLNTLRELGVDKLSVIIGGEHFYQIPHYIKDGSDFGFSSVNYYYQSSANGIAAAINLVKNEFESEEYFYVILGDNWFHTTPLFNSSSQSNKAQIVLFRSYNTDLHRFGVATININGKIIQIEEKPKVLSNLGDNFAITGLYKFNRDFFKYFKEIKPSTRGEYEITNIIQMYLDNDDLDYTFLPHESMWSDLGTFETLDFVRDYIKNGN